MATEKGSAYCRAGYFRVRYSQRFVVWSHGRYKTGGYDLLRNFLEEAERGYKKTLELGNYELDTWLARADILINIGEYEAAVFSLIQTSEFYSEQAEIEYRLAGLYFITNQPIKGRFYLKNALNLDKDYIFIIEELFPTVFKRKSIKEIVSKFKKA